MTTVRQGQHTPPTRAFQHLIKPRLSPILRSSIALSSSLRSLRSLWSNGLPEPRMPGPGSPFHRSTVISFLLPCLFMLFFGSAGGTGITTGQLLQSSTFLAAGWDYEQVWTQTDGKTIPCLSTLTQPGKTHQLSIEVDNTVHVYVYPEWTLVTLTPAPAPGYALAGWTCSDLYENAYFYQETITVLMDKDITVKTFFLPDAPISIQTVEDLQKIGNDFSFPLWWDYILENDIDASATATWDGGTGFSPIGGMEDPFTGAFDGQGHVISNLTINQSYYTNLGLFVYIGEIGEIKNIGLIRCSVSGTTAYIGGLAGYNQGKITQCYVIGSVSGRDNVGGLIGKNYGGAVSQCYVTGSVSGSEGVIGGLIGSSSYGSFTQCYAAAIVSGTRDSVGGLIGSSYDETITQCYAAGTVTGHDDVGGLIGFARENTASQCYAVGAVTGRDNIGGLIGVDRESTVEISFWDTQTSGQTSSSGGTGKTTAEMVQQATFTDWDFLDVWNIIENTTYPYLQCIPFEYQEGEVTPPDGWQDEGEGAFEGQCEGTLEGQFEGETEMEGEYAWEGQCEGEWYEEGEWEGEAEGEGEYEGIAEGEGAIEGEAEGQAEGESEGAEEGMQEEGAPEEGELEGIMEGALEGEGAPEEGEAEEWENPLDMQLNHQINVSEYTPGQPLEITLTLSGTSTEDLRAIALAETLPGGWTFSSMQAVSGDLPPIAPSSGDTDILEFLWINMPNFPYSFTYTAIPPEDACGPVQLSGQLFYRTNGPEYRSSVSTHIINGPLCQEWENPRGATLNQRVTVSAYRPAHPISIILTISFASTHGLQAVGLYQTLPSGWTFAEMHAVRGELPALYDLDSGCLSFAWIEIPQFPITFTYTIIATADACGPVQIPGQVLYRTNDPEYRSSLATITIDGPDCNEVWENPLAAQLIQQASISEYFPGQSMDITLTLNFSGTEGLAAVGLYQIFPPGWAFVGMHAISGELPPLTQQEEYAYLRSFAWFIIPSFPITFAYTVTPPPDACGPAQIIGQIIYRTDGPAYFSDRVTTPIPGPACKSNAALLSLALTLQDNFQKADRDNDNQLTFKEAMDLVPELVQSQFIYLDANDDGYLSQDELSAYAAMQLPAGCHAKLNHYCTFRTWLKKSLGDLFLSLLLLIAFRRVCPRSH